MSARVFKSRQNPCSLILGLPGSWLPSRFFLVLPSWPTGCLVAMSWPAYGGNPLLRVEDVSDLG